MDTLFRLFLRLLPYLPWLYRSSRYLRARRSRVTDTDTPRRPGCSSRRGVESVIGNLRLVLHGDQILSSIPKTLSRDGNFTPMTSHVGRETARWSTPSVFVPNESGARPAARKYCVAISASRIFSRSRISRAQNGNKQRGLCRRDYSLNCESAVPCTPINVSYFLRIFFQYRRKKQKYSGA